MQYPRTLPQIDTYFLILVLASVFFNFASVRCAYADGTLGGLEPKQPTPVTRGGATTRQYDQRLPAVMPGEEIVTETGQKMRVWSSAGPVPVMQQPTPQPWPNNVNNNGQGGVGVIVDGRPLRDR